MFQDAWVVTNTTHDSPENLQMVVKMCVPAANILKLFPDWLLCTRASAQF
jgi:hypothetical protein